MKTNYVLVDYENVQPKDIALLREGPFRVKVFLGPNQAKIPIGLATSLQALGAKAEYVLLETAGSNALDFHIAYYIGTLSTQDRSAFFHIISKDSGFDPLIKHLKAKGVLAQRSACIADMPFLKPSPPSTSDARVEIVIADLAGLKAAKPRTQKTLLGNLHALFKKELSEQHRSLLRYPARDAAARRPLSARAGHARRWCSFPENPVAVLFFDYTAWRGADTRERH